MVFSDPNFLFFFLPAVIAGYFLLPKTWRNIVLLFASWGFYTAGSGSLIGLLVISTGVDYVAGRMAGRGVVEGRGSFIRWGVWISVITNVGLLSYFKYANFFIEQVNGIRATVGYVPISWTSVVLPIGISFYTFQSMSYTIDVARGRVEPIRNPLDFALYVALFPQLIAGPIVRFHEIADEITYRDIRAVDLAEGVIRFTIGLFKKVVVADAVALVVEPAFALDPATLTTLAAWLGVVAYTIQIYFDFSGYSDMAIGLGRILGFHFPENFRRPYSSQSITDFWRRWHITLSNWFRDYVYISLGGSRGSTKRTYFNLIVVFLVTGLWHGANWTFVVWGAYHGAFLVFERLIGQRPVGDDARNSAVRRAYSLLVVMVGWVLFRSTSLTHAWQYLSAMFSWTTGPLPPEIALSLTTRVQLTLLLSSFTVLLPGSFVTGIVVPQSKGRWPTAARAVVMALLLPYSLAVVATGTFSPFLYYQF